MKDFLEFVGICVIGFIGIALLAITMILSIAWATHFADCHINHSTYYSCEIEKK